MPPLAHSLVRPHRRTLTTLIAALVIVLTAAFAVAVAGQARAAEQPAVPRQAGHRVVHRERRHPGVRGGRRQHRHPLVERVQPTRSGSRSTSARPPPSTRSSSTGRRPTRASFQIQISANGTTWTTVYSTTTGAGGVQTLTVSGSGRYVRMNGTVRAPRTATRSGSSRSSARSAAPRLRHRQRRAGPPGDRVVDRERHAPGLGRGRRQHRHPLVERVRDPQWLQVDLGAPRTVCQVVLNWEAAYARSFQIQVSADGTTWTTIFTTTTGTGGTQTLNVNGTGRYVRMNGTARGHRVRLLAVGVRRPHHRDGHRPTAVAADPPSRPGRLLGRHQQHPGRAERGDAEDPQPDQRPLPGQPGVLELQRGGPLDRRAAVPRHAGQLGRPDVLLPRLAEQPVLRLHRVHRRRRRSSTATPPGSTRSG